MNLRGYVGLIVLCLVSILTPAWAKSGSFTVVIDAGHGGKDPGAIGHGYKEKDVVLAIAKKLGKRIKAEHSGVRVLYTRERDVFVGLQARADFANRHKASLFISIHANSAGSNTSVSGTETYVLGLSKQSSNLSVAMRENKAMLLEDNYQTIYKGFDPNNTESYIMFDVMQEAYLARSIDMATFVERQYRSLGRSSRGVRQDALWVLSQSAMPSILTEVGFISNPREARYMGSDEGQDELAAALARAFTKFYSGRDTDGREQSSEARETAEDLEARESSTAKSRKERSTPNASEAKSGNTRYRVQLMSDKERIDTKDKRFTRLGTTVKRERLGRLWIYTVGNTSSLKDAKALRQRVRKYYPDCFIVEYQGTTRVGRAN